MAALLLLLYSNAVVSMQAERRRIREEAERLERERVEALKRAQVMI